MTASFPIDATLDVLRPTHVRRLMDELPIRPRKALGQNFLIDRNIRDLAVAAAGVGADETVLEVGPGLGALTEALVARARLVIAVEKDPVLAAFLRRRFAAEARLRLVEADMLACRLDDLAAGAGPVTRVVANLPYSVGSRILVDLVQAARPPVGMVLTVQREVADRLAAGPGSSDYGLLSIWVQRLYRVEIVHTVGPGCFLPAPEVKSAIVKLTWRAGGGGGGAAFYALSRQAFNQRRKQVARTLATGGRTVEQIRAALAAVGVGAAARPEELTADQWVALAGLLGGHQTGPA